MSARAVIDSLAFARSAGQLSGEVQVADLGRLAEGLAAGGGVLRYALTGETDGRGRPRLRLRVDGGISLVCQRCLGSLPHEVAVESVLLVLDGGESAPAEDLDDLDAVKAESEFDVWSLVEDEVLLALPMAPRHAEGACNAAPAAGVNEAASPFAALAGLKSRPVN